MSDPLKLGAVALGKAIAAQALDARDVVRAGLDAVRRDDPQGTIFVRLLETRALAEADAAADRAKRGMLRSRLDGVPIAWKDCIDVVGGACEAGSPLLKDRQPTDDAVAVGAAARAGLVSFGKTSMTELAFSGLGYNPSLGTPANPFDAKTPRLPGGSSAGAGVALARHLAPLAIGTDTGGSVRIPAAWNGLVGLKTTIGRLSTKGVVPLSPSLDTLGPLARSIEDAAAIYEILSGEGPIDLDASAPRDFNLMAVDGALLAEVEPPVMAAYREAIEKLRAAGFRIALKSVRALEEAMPVAGPAAAEAYALWGAAIEASPGIVFERVAERVLAGKAMMASEVFALKAKLGGLAAKLVVEIAGSDAVLLPTVATQAPPIADIEASPEAYRAINVRTLSLPSLANRLGLAAISVPAGLWGEPALPVGLSILGRPFSERRLLQIASAVSRATPRADWGARELGMGQGPLTL